MITNTIPGKKESVNTEEQFLDAIQIAKICGMNPQTLRVLAKRGKVSAIKIGRTWRFPKSLLIPKPSLPSQLTSKPPKASHQEGCDHV
jgi:hypothetical protein